MEGGQRPCDSAPGGWEAGLRLARRGWRFPRKPGPEPHGLGQVWRPSAKQGWGLQRGWRPRGGRRVGGMRGLCRAGEWHVPQMLGASCRQAASPCGGPVGLVPTAALLPPPAAGEKTRQTDRCTAFQSPLRTLSAPRWLYPPPDGTRTARPSSHRGQETGKGALAEGRNHETKRGRDEVQTGLSCFTYTNRIFYEIGIFHVLLKMRRRSPFHDASTFLSTK